MVDLKQALDAAKGKIATIKMQGLVQPVTDVSAKIAGAN
jgi:hypothetical protein